MAEGAEREEEEEEQEKGRGRWHGVLASVVFYGDQGRGAVIKYVGVRGQS